MAIELSASNWKLGFADQLGRKPRVRSINAGDSDQGEGKPLGEYLIARLTREFDRLALATEQIRALQMQQAKRHQQVGPRGELRVLMIEIAWGRLMHQPESELTKWYHQRFGDGTKRNRKIGVVALARKLLVALGKYVRDGEVPAGAKLIGER